MLFITSKGFFTLFLLCFSCRQNRRQLFPTRTEQECLAELRKHPRSYFAYQNMTQEWKNRFLGFMEGKKTLPLTYDPFFKKLFNPDIYPERLSSLISSIIGTKVTVQCILSNEDSMLPSTSLLLLDILVELEDGLIANVEILKIPFTGFSSVVLFTDVSPFRSGTGVLSTSAAGKSYTLGSDSICL